MNIVAFGRVIVFLFWLCAGESFAQVQLGQADMTSTARFFASGPEQQLELAIRRDDRSSVERAIASGARPNARGKKDATPLMVAVDAQSPQATAALLRAGATPNLQATDGTSAVSLAVENHATLPHGHAILLLVMAGGGDPNTLRPDRDPVIMRFVRDHDLEALRWFKSLGADLDIQGRGPRPLIVNAAYGQNWDSVWCLIELGARYDYEQTSYAISSALDTPYGSADSPMFPYKEKVWQFLKDKGIAVPPLERGSVKPPAPPPAP